MGISAIGIVTHLNLEAVAGLRFACRDEAGSGVADHENNL
jgi:hypothetical protein